MFGKLRRKTAFYQMIIIGAVLLVVFAFSGVYNYEKMIAEVDRRLDTLEKVGVFFSDNTIPNLEHSESRNALIIRVYNDGKNKLSDVDFYDEETIINIIAVAKNGADHVVINGNYLAYSVADNGGGAFYTIYLYDYTGDYNAFIVNLLTILITFVLVVIVVGFFITHFTTSNLKPIEDAFNRQKELVANASHELKTPLTIINTNLSILNSFSDEFTEEQKKWLHGIGTQVNRMSNMINEMLVLARIEAVREKDFERVNLSEITQSVVLETETLAFEKLINMEDSIADNVSVMGKKADVEKLVYILLENALKYTPSGGKITVNLGVEKHKAVLKVHNTGDGIPKELMPKLFDRFYRCDEAHTASGSFGLGLSIAKAIADSHNATIGVDSKQGKFTEFIVYFKENA